ncbi:MBL fold metallo-hydrolase [Halosegnis marinus]|uniref:MBL fold metallo-hydrolase n=1 Tax=Halosegnis marinus TaxID=3034023 RepID=A0ABD5ZQ21_9EURY|nr:MBL fold metallo-hydrolase [Halosegnis sp. DT85]
MAIGDLYEVDYPSVSDVYYLDTGMYDAEAYGALYIVDAPEPAVIDTGMGTHVDNTVAALDTLGIDAPTYIVPTHVHLDHAGGAGYLAAEYPDATVVCPDLGVRHLVDPSRLWAGTKAAVGKQIEFYREPKPIPEERIRSVSGGDELDLGDRALDVYDAPGHAPHQAVFHSPDDDATFVADAAGIWAESAKAVRPTSPPSNFDLERCLADVQTLRDLDPAVLMYAHYGPTATGNKLDRYERVLTDWVRLVEATREEYEDDDAVVEAVASEVEVVEPWSERKVYEEAAMNVRGVLRYLDERGDE